MDKIYLKDNYIVTEIGGLTTVFPKNYSSYSENTTGFYLNSSFPVNNPRTVYIDFTRVTSIYDESGLTAYSVATLRSFFLTNTGFKSPSGGSGGVWGSITGTLSDQTDLQSALNAKQNTLISGTNIKTINGNTLLGSGDLTISTGITVGTTPVTSGTDGRVFFQSGGVVQQDSSFFWDNTNKRLAVGTSDTTSPSLGTAYTNIKAYRATGNSSLTLGVGTNTWDVGNTGGIGLWGVYNNNVRFVVTNAGLFGIGTTSPQSRLDVRSQGALSTDIAFRVRNSADTANLLSTDGTGATRVLTSFKVGTSALSSGVTTETEGVFRAWTSLQIGQFGNLTINQTSLSKQATGADFFQFNNTGSLTASIGTYYFLQLRNTVAPTSGTAVANMLDLNLTVNQTGGANGITRGLFVNPTLTSAFDFRAIETVRGNVLFNTTSGSTSIGATAPNASAKLQVDSTTQGFLPPRMTTTERTAIATPAAGLMVYDTTLNKHYGFDGTNWNALY